MAIKVSGASLGDMPAITRSLERDAKAIAAMVRVAGAAKVDITGERPNYVQRLNQAFKHLELPIVAMKLRKSSLVWCGPAGTVADADIEIDGCLCGMADCVYSGDVSIAYAYLDIVEPILADTIVEIPATVSARRK